MVRAIEILSTDMIRYEIGDSVGDVNFAYPFIYLIEIYKNRFYVFIYLSKNFLSNYKNPSLQV